MSNLYPIIQQHKNLLYQIEEAEGEVTDEQLQAFELNGIEIERNAVSLAFGIKSLEDKEQVIKKEIDRLKSLLDSTVNKKERIKDYLSYGMQQAGITEIKGDTLKLSFRKSESVVIENEKALPNYYVNTKTTVTPDKALIKQSLKNGVVVPGASLITNNNLQIK